jgi:hypothetical protein
MRHIVILSAIALSAVLTPARAAPATLEGAWSGSGIVSYRNGADPLSCRVRYARSAGKSFTVSAMCASDTGRYELSGSVASAGGNRYTGTVHSTQQNQSGTVSLSLHGNSQSVTVTSRRGSARLTLSRR